MGEEIKRKSLRSIFRVFSGVDLKFQTLKTAVLKIKVPLRFLISISAIFGHNTALNTSVTDRALKTAATASDEAEDTAKGE